MPITMPQVWVAGEVLTADKLNANPTAIAAWSSSIAGSDLEDGTVPNAKLINQYSEFLVTLECKPTTAAAPVASATVPMAVVGLPGSTTDGGGYTVLSATHSLVDSGDAAAVTAYNVSWGDFTNTAAWTEVASVISATNVTSVTAGGFVGGKPAIATSALSLVDANARFLALFVTAIGANALNTAYSSFTVALKLKRTSGLRA